MRRYMQPFGTVNIFLDHVHGPFLFFRKCVAFWIEGRVHSGAIGNNLGSERQMSIRDTRIYKGTLVTSIATAMLLAFGLFSPRAYGDTYPRQPGIKILRYTFDVTLGDASDELVVKDSIDLE